MRIVRDSRHVRRIMFCQQLVLISMVIASVAAAQSVNPYVAPEQPTWTAVVAPRIAGGDTWDPLGRLPAASAAAGDQLNALRAWNDAGRLPLRNGFTRPLPLPQPVVLVPPLLITNGPVTHAGGLLDVSATRLQWTARIVVVDAFRLRLHLADVQLPSDARLWVQGAGGETAGPFGLDMAAPDGLWTPSVAGPDIMLFVELLRRPEVGEELRFTIDEVLEIVPVPQLGQPAEQEAESAEGLAAPLVLSCLTDARCIGTGHLGIIED
jgi:hypothetical protein